MSELDDFLQEQSHEGERESTGRFELDLARARLLLGKYQLPQPDLYLLKFVQTGVAGGARRLHIHTRDYGWELLWDQDSRAFPPRAKEHMTAGLLAFLTQSEGTACRCLHSDGEVLFQEGHPGEHPSEETWWTHQLVLEQPPEGFWKKLGHWGQRPEEQHLQERCGHAAIPLLLNDQVLNHLGGAKGQPLGSGVVGFLAPHRNSGRGGYFLSREASGDLLSVPPAAPEEKVVQVLWEKPDWPALENAAPISTLLCDGHCALYAWASVHTHSASWSMATFVLDGVDLEPERNILDRPGYVASISARGLNHDLSGLALVRDEAYFERLSAVKGLIRQVDTH